MRDVEPEPAVTVEPSADDGLGRLLLVLRLVGRQGVGDIAARRAGFARFMARLPQPPALPARERTLGGVATLEIAPDGFAVPPADGVAARTPAIVFLHGGGYCLGGVDTHRALATRLARAAGARVLLPAYRLAPEHPFPAAFEDALRAWRALAAAEPHTARVLGGDSAGGGLAIGVAAALRAGGEPMPRALFALSPWVDLTGTAASIDARAARDLLVDRAGLEGMAALYLAGADPRDPRASPLFGELRGLPPTLVQVGEEECLYDDAAGLVAALQAHDVEATLEARPRMVHVWPLYAGVVRAGEGAIARLGEWLRRRLSLVE